MIDHWSGLKYWRKSMHKGNAIRLWKFDNIDEFKELTMRDMKWAYQTRSSGLMQYTDQYEQTQSIEAIARGYTNYNENDVDYFINDGGFRGNWHLGTHAMSTLGVFGCSFTFGVGLPEKDIYPHIIGRHLDCQVFNFGVPGGSINRATRYFSLASKFQKFDYAIFLVPHAGRMEMPSITKDTLYSMNVIPNWETADANEEEKRKQVYRALDDNFFEFDTLKNINQCIDIAKANNTKIYFSSWDIPTYDLIYDYLGEDSGMLLPWFEVIEFHTKEKKNLARDGAHPGPASHLNFYKRSIPYLK
jgi:hypothetical protein